MDEPAEVSALPPWPPRPADPNKGTFGRLLVIAGSRGMSGAAVLAGVACLRGGAGLVRVATPADARLEVAMGSPCLITEPLAQDADGRFDRSVLTHWLLLAAASDAVALGPGIGR